jgi:hypothetical protein
MSFLIRKNSGRALINSIKKVKKMENQGTGLWHGSKSPKKGRSLWKHYHRLITMSGKWRGIEMTNPLLEISQCKTAQFAGLLYLVMAVCSGFGLMYVNKQLYVPGDAVATISNIQAHEWLFRLGIFSNLAGQIIFLFLVYVLYKLFRSVDEDQARLMVILVVVSVPITCLNILNQLAAILFISGAGYLSAFSSAQLQVLAMLFLDMYQYGILIAGIFWGLWLFPFGLLVFRSGFIPRVLGVLLMVAGFGYVISSLTEFLFPGISAIISPVANTACLGELPIILWLLIIGVNDLQPPRLRSALWVKRNEFFMKAIVITKYWLPEVLKPEEVPMPVPKDNEMLVKFHTVSLNYRNPGLMSGKPLLIRLMVIGLFRPKTRIPGSDAAGRVESVGTYARKLVPDVFGDLSACSGAGPGWWWEGRPGTG